MSRKKKTKTKINFDEVTITNDLMFGYVMRDEEICKGFISTILGTKIQHVDTIDYQKTIDLKLGAHSIRLDIFAENENGIFDCEMQTSNSSSLPKRGRYYHSTMDLDLLDKGIPYEQLKESYVIFVCTFDPFGMNDYLYEIRNSCAKRPNLKYKDGQATIYVNIHGTEGDVSDTFKELMAYFADINTADTSTDSLVQRIHQKVIETRQNEDWRHDYMTLQMYGEDKRKEGIQEGIQEGINQGRMQEIFRSVIDRDYSAERGAEKLGISVEEFQKQLEAFKKSTNI